jgi:calcium-dependent protein kinase
MFCCGAGGDGGGSAGEGERFKVIEAKGWVVEKQAIGEGGFGTVHLCKNVRTGKTRACKAMRVPSDLDRDDFRAEVLVLKKVKTHRNICHILDSAEDARYGYLVMQSCTGGELFEAIAARKVTEKDAALACVDVLSALNFIQTKRILHRDLKPENLLYKDKSPGAPLKLIDFGLALQLRPDERATEVCGTTSYMAPEVLNANYAFECDIWSLGVITYFMLSGTLPFPGRNDDEKEARILSGQVSFSGRHWATVSEEGKDFVQRMLAPKARNRLSGKQALHHKWITNRAKLSDEPLSADVAKSLKRYAEAHRFEKAIRHQMATHLTSTELHRLRNTFERLDVEGTGNVSIDSLMTSLKTDAADAHTAETLASMDLSAFDLDGDGQIDWQEFVAGAMADHELYNEETLEEIFMKLDEDKNGTLCQKEVAKLMGEDHEFSREMLEEIQSSRPDGAQGAEELHMTLPEFKAAPKTPDDRTSRTTHGRRRHHHAPVSKAQYAQDEQV